MRLEAISDGTQQETVRRALELVVGITPDDVEL
jgi:hypothetical protein